MSENDSLFQMNESINDKGIFKAVVLAGHSGAGKAQPLYSKVLTTTGWKIMGDIGIGDTLISPTGGTSKVLEIHPQGIKKIYRVRLFDGRYTDCTLEHLWCVSGFTKDGKNSWTIRATEELYNKKEMPAYKGKFCLPLPQPMEMGVGAELCIHPYLMGVLLGDGCFKERSLSFTSVDEEIRNKVSSIIEKDGFFINQYKTTSYIRIIGNEPGVSRHKYISYLRDSGLYGKNSFEKYIPEEYKNTTIENRFEIIRGLLDTDGYVSETGFVQFYTTSKRLADDFRYLIWSVGGNTILKTKQGSYKKNGIKVKCREIYNITVYYRNPEELFFLKRKRDRASVEILQKRNPRNHLRCKIEDIYYVGDFEAKCISIDKEDGLYITDDFIVTHNSYTLSKIKSGSIDPRIVNVDRFIERFGGKYSPDAYDRSKLLLEHQLALFLDSMLPLAVDVTASTTTSVLRRYGILEYLGYDQGMVFVNCSLETALERARQRAKLPPPLGRVVPDEVVIAYYNDVKKVKGYLKQKFNPFIEINNDIGELTNEVVLDAFKRMESFYNSPIRNHIGREAVSIMRENGWKYLSDGIFTRAEINNMADMWYTG